jgi:hypothetical protein
MHRHHLYLPLLTSLLLILVPAVRADSPVPLAVDNGRCEFVVPAGQPNDQYLLIVGSLTTSVGPFPVRITTDATTASEPLPREQTTTDPAWHKRVQALASRQALARRQALVGTEPTVKEPPQTKDFSLFVKENDFHNPGNYRTVRAKLSAVGKSSQVYVDESDLTGAGAAQRLQPTIEEVVRYFDNQVKPNAIGHAVDIDRDGRFTILLSGLLSKMQDGKVHLSGFVRGSDFYRDLDIPFSNRCDMMYLNSDLKPGPYLRSVIAHEYAHAVVFSEHYYGDYCAGTPRQDEEGWLNEAIAHLVEDRAEQGWANLDYRVSAFLSCPERYSLVIPDYYARRLWRDPGSRGSAYLFLRWCVDRFGDDLLTRLVRSNLNGINNLEVATQMPFAELFRKWTLALALSGTGIDCDDTTALGRINLRGGLGERLLCGPRYNNVSLVGGKCDIDVAATGAAYFLLHDSGATGARVVVHADPSARLQVTLLHLPRDLPRLLVNAFTDSSGLRVTVGTSQTGVRLLEAAWEHLVTCDTAAGDTSFCSGQKAADSVRAWFGAVELNAGQTMTGSAVTIPDDSRDLVVKVLASDEQGRRITGWSVLHRGP